MVTLNPLSQFNIFMTTFFGLFPWFVQAFIGLVIVGYVIRALINIFNR